MTALMTPLTARKKPVEVRATHWDGSRKNADQIIAWCRDYGVHTYLVTPDDEPITENELHIETLEGTMSARPGDWIIQGVAGEFCPCKPDIFDRTYDVGPAPEPAPEPVTLPDGTAVNALLLAMRNCGDHVETVSTALIVDPQETAAALLTRMYGLDSPNPYGYPNDPRDSRIELRLAVTDWPLPRPQQQPADTAESPF